MLLQFVWIWSPAGAQLNSLKLPILRCLWLFMPMPHKTSICDDVLGGRTYRTAADHGGSESRTRRRCLLLLNKWRIRVLRVCIWVCYSEWNLSPDLGVTRGRGSFFFAVSPIASNIWPVAKEQQKMTRRDNSAEVSFVVPAVLISWWFVHVFLYLFLFLLSSSILSTKVVVVIVIPYHCGW